MQNRKVMLIRRPTGDPVETDFSIVDEDVAPLEVGQVLVKVETLSIDAFIRTTFNEVSFHQGSKIGNIVPALGIGVVLESRDDGFSAGDYVFGALCSQSIACMPGVALRRLDVSVVPPNSYVGILGLTTGMTSYFGIVDVGAVKKGDTVVVSGAAGAVGSLAGQIARLSGASRVIGIAGGPHKTAFLVDELGFDAAIDYKNEDVETRLGELAPNGVDVFYDNVGGDTLDAVLMHIKDGTRVVICGAISQYQDMDNVRGPKNYLKLAERHATMAGFAVFHFAEHYERAEKQLTQWLASGQLIMREHIEQGIDRFPAALNILQNGGHHGKLLVRVAENS